jgi:hypothetical protein
MVDAVVEKRLAPEQAGRELGRLCPCGVFNHIRAAEELEKMADKRAAGSQDM